ncbi:SAM-dependent methyltransferase [Candidatus Chrysopegis kryptomonas]|uniref:Methyltransferase domain-containing protein n=1 Tax=Candidatus Chryseopegocella kryptomonas TaxID=1633643 RepID=A0A0N7MVV5_9BACT|nr:methyltransferase domain-containing protein [Candidatus Chrysopegis kryptomonas]CUS96899.1 Methyltransferase domain-containing protein [Candidatus Chrysopegis kryptomonas]
MKSKTVQKLPTLGGSNSTKLICSKVEIKDGMNVLIASVNLRESVVYVAKNFNCHIYGIYEIPQVVFDAKSEIAEAGLDDKVKVKMMSPVNLDFEDEIFDLIISEGILSQYKKSRILKEFRRVLKKDSFIGIADFYWKKTPVPTYVKDAWYVEGGEIETLDEKIKILKDYGFEPTFVKDISDELRVYYSRFKKIIQSSLKERKFTKSEFKEVKKFKHEVSVYLDQGGDKWMGYVVIVAKKI